ncbi:hypothetical protein ANCCAN_14486 [Ancylostoma caninum]|uniref:PDZ domain-containing protein n=1 Tax=Ancylostoma caninum TaxID=29170 RepID=A0A368G7C6_ANCCA|nr:hypothetical protein ANCCAN_14486 [Ancylostoma caninum]
MLEPPQLVRGKAHVKLKSPIVGVEVKESKVTSIQAYSQLIGYLFVGDILVAINGVKVSNTVEFSKAVNSKVPGIVVIEYLRDEMCTCNMKPLPPRRQGYERFEITLIWRSGGTPIGLLIHRNFSGRVVVAMVESGCTASKVVRAGDALLKLIMESINKSKKVSLTLERCILPPTIVQSSLSVTQHSSSAPSSTSSEVGQLAPKKSSSGEFKTAVATSFVNTKVDVALPVDVLSILEANKKFFMVECTLPPCLKRNKEEGVPKGAHLDLPPCPHTETTIPYDPSPKPLKMTPKRVGS